MFNIGRFQYSFPWHLYKWGFSRNPMFGHWGHGADEYHNKSIYLLVPGLGYFVWFKTNNRILHTGSATNKIPDIAYTPGCEICQELKVFIEED